MTSISVQHLKARREALLQEIETLNVRLDEIDTLINLAGETLPRDPPAGYLGAGPVRNETGFVSTAVTKARNPRKIRKEQS